MTATQRPELLDATWTEQWCRITVNSLNHLRQHHRFAPAIKIGRRCFWTPADLNSWIESQREKAA